VRVAVLGALLATAACGARYPHPVYSAQPTSALEAVTLEPPPARAENVPARPAGAVVWIDGEWLWHRHRWQWVRGRWVLPPAGATYSPWCTVRSADGTLYFAPSAWRDASGKTVAAPKAIAVAGVESGAVVDAEGDPERTTVAPP